MLPCVGRVVHPHRNSTCTNTLEWSPGFLASFRADEVPGGKPISRGWVVNEVWERYTKTAIEIMGELSRVCVLMRTA